MKINSQLVFALLLQSAFHLSAQENVNRFNQSGPAFPLITSQENDGSDENKVSVKSGKTIDETFLEPEATKIYVHLDRTVFLAGDTIWFKAYLWHGYDQIPDYKSILLYVDLLGPDGKAIEKKKLPVFYGTAFGEFNLPPFLNEGTYTICAYTSDRQKPGTVHPFYQAVTINNPSQSFAWECNPTLLKGEFIDSLSLGLRFFEIDTLGEVRKDYLYDVNYSISLGSRILLEDIINLRNSQEKIIAFSLPGLQQEDTMITVSLSTQTNKRNIQNQFFIPLDKQPDIQFLPEGGFMVNGLESKVAFKAIDIIGLSREVKGEIRNKEGDTLLGFESSHKGMGYFMFTPMPGNEYEAFVEYKKMIYRYPLPKALEEGSVMTLNPSAEDSFYDVMVQCSPSGMDRMKYLVGTSYGKVRFVTEININKGRGHITVPLDSFPEGIARITLLNDLFKPECERLIYVDKNQRFSFMIVPDSLSYGHRSKVSLAIKAFRADWKPGEAWLSLAVVDAGQVITDDLQSGICSYKLLESELKGFIEDPGYYFKEDGGIRNEELDLLLLTQGYRIFPVQKSSIVTSRYDSNEGFNISGRVELRAGESRKEKYNYSEIELTLLILKLLYTDKGHPDEQGNFQFRIPFMYNNPIAIIQARDSRGNPVYGDIILDEATTEPLFTLSDILPVRHNGRYTKTEYVEQMQVSRKTEISKISGGASMFLELPEVTVKAKGRSMDLDLEKMAIWEASLDTMDPAGDKYRDIFEILINEYNAMESWGEDSVTGKIKRVVLFPCSCFDPIRSHSEPIYIINGKRAYHGEQEDISGDKIKKVMVIPPITLRVSSYLYDEMTEKYTVVVETYDIEGYYRGSPRNVITFPVEGLNASRKFYAPGYDKPAENTKVYDGRTTLYWNPYISTDANGLAKVEFFTSDRSTELIIIVNGIDKRNGNPGQGEIRIKTN